MTPRSAALVFVFALALAPSAWAHDFWIEPSTFRPRVGSELAVALEISGTPARPRGATVIATSANGGRSWRSRLVPGPTHWWRVDLIDPRHWCLSDGTALLATDDAGRHWRRWKAPVRMTDAVGAPLALNFLSPNLGFAVPEANSGPLWWTRNGGTTWQPITITAGPFTLPR